MRQWIQRSSTIATNKPHSESRVWLGCEMAVCRTARRQGTNKRKIFKKADVDGGEMRISGSDGLYLYSSFTRFTIRPISSREEKLGVSIDTSTIVTLIDDRKTLEQAQNLVIEKLSVNSERGKVV